MKRREENQNRAQARFEPKVVEKLAEARAISTAEAIEIVDAYMRAFREALDEGRVRVDNASDFNTMTRLKQFLEGKADSRQEMQGVITLEQMQARHRALRAQLESLDPAITGEVPPRERDRARGQLAEQVERGDSPNDTALAPRRASERIRTRRLPAEHPHGGQADRPAATARRPADGGEPAPRRRVVADYREDVLLDDELAQEREYARRGNVRALRRRTRDDMDLGHDTNREEARVPRRAAAPRPGRPGREARVEGPDVVYPRSPGRGWETESQHDRSVLRPGRGW